MAENKIMRFGIIAQGVNEFVDEMKEAERKYGNFDYDRIMESFDADEIASELERIGATDKTHTVEVFFTDEEGEFIEGSDFWGGAAFKEARKNG